MYQSVIRDPGGDRLVRVVPDVQPVNGSLLIVPADTVAVFVCNGALSPPYAAGRHTLHTGTAPFFVRLRNLMTQGDPALSVSVFFVAVGLETVLQLGTGAFLFTEHRFHLSMRALASFTVRYRIGDPLRFLRRLVGLHSDRFGQEDLEPALRALLLAPVREQLSRRLSADAIPALQNDVVALGHSLTEALRPAFDAFGIALHDLTGIHVNVDDGDLQRLHALETEHARGRVATDTEKYNLEQIYGTLDRRTLIEVMTGVTRAADRAQDGPQPHGAGGVGGMAGVMASLPLQMAVFQQVAAALREPVAEMTRQADFFTREPPPREAAHHEPNGGNAGRGPALPKQCIPCALCATPIPRTAATCPVCNAVQP